MSTPKTCSRPRPRNARRVCSKPSASFSSFASAGAYRYRHRHFGRAYIGVPLAYGAYSYGGGLWTVGQLSKFIQARHTDVWPRIDKILGCPDELKSMVTRTVTGIVSPP